MILSEEQLTVLRTRIKDAKQPDHKLVDTRAFLHGWNEALGHVEKVIREILGEK
jgi:hypothetical protein